MEYLVYPKVNGVFQLSFITPARSKETLAKRAKKLFADRPVAIKQVGNQFAEAVRNSETDTMGIYRLEENDGFLCDATIY